MREKAEKLFRRIIYICALSQLGEMHDGGVEIVKEGVGISQRT
jgi:hypothetical protein